MLVHFLHYVAEVQFSQYWRGVLQIEHETSSQKYPTSQAVQASLPGH